MVSRKHKKSIAQASDTSLIPPAPAMKVKNGAYLGCHTWKICCIFAPNGTTCNKCIQSRCPKECIIQESYTCSHSTSLAPPSHPSDDSRTQKYPPMTATSRKNTLFDKRQVFKSTDVNSNIKQCCRALSEDPTTTQIGAHVMPAAGDLTMIFELDEPDPGLASDNDDILPDHGFEKLTGKILSIVTGHGSSAIDFDEECQPVEDEMSKDFDFDGIMVTTDKELQRSSSEIGSETDDDMCKLLQKHSYWKPTARRARLYQSQQIWSAMIQIHVVSIQPMKAVTVYFKDAALDEDSAAPTSTSNHGKVCTKSGLESQAIVSSKQKPPSNEIEGIDVQQKHVEELQKRWTCNMHSKGSQSPMKEEATVDVKPPSIITQGVKQHTQNMGGSSIVDQAAAAAVQGIEVPDIIPWFQSLEQYVKKSLHGVKLGDLGPELDTKGFVDISQLSHKYISTQELQDMLKIEKGTAILIFQHVDADLWAIHSGTCQ
ncbi:hypothetical protein HD554DRAFT_2040668 [Boletus coccyginus]|nr:hypothetical protein HD554DRAFT_2040668 [Boletus coccyginus]